MARGFVDRFVGTSSPLKRYGVLRTKASIGPVPVNSPRATTRESSTVDLVTADPEISSWDDDVEPSRQLERPATDRPLTSAGESSMFHCLHGGQWVASAIGSACLRAAGGVAVWLLGEPTSGLVCLVLGMEVLLTTRSLWPGFFTADPQGRMWSNLGESRKHAPGTVWGSAALVAGTTVGAGVLALPAVTQESGFVASSGALLGCAAFSIVTGLLIAEVNLMTICDLGVGGISLKTMAERTLGRHGSQLVTATYVFLHYALLVAYVSRGGEVLSALSGSPTAIGTSAFTVVFGGLCFFASTRQMEAANSLLVLLVISSFLALVAVAAGDVDGSTLFRSKWEAVPDTLPVVALAFVYQNVVPVITSSLEGDRRKITQAIVIGVAIPLVMFLAWEAAILGSLGTLAAGSGDLAASGSVTDPLALLQQSSRSTVVGPAIQAFSFLAVATSYIGFVLGLSDFLADALRLPSSKQIQPYLLTLLPPLLFAVLFKDVFFQALDLAGTYGVLVLFGILPVLMAWSERYCSTTLSSVELVPGGRLMLLVVGGFAGGVIVKEALEAMTSLL